MLKNASATVHVMQQDNRTETFIKISPPVSPVFEDFSSLARYGFPMSVGEANIRAELNNGAHTKYTVREKPLPCDELEERTLRMNKSHSQVDASLEPAQQHELNSKRLKRLPCRPKNGEPCEFNHICSQTAGGQLPCERLGHSNGSMAFDFTGAGNICLRTASPLHIQPKRTMSNSTSVSGRSEEGDPVQDVQTGQSGKRQPQNPHSQVERKYRESLALRFDKLRRHLPGLNCKKDEDLEDLSGPSKVSKADILNSAIEYVRQSEKQKKAMADELDNLKAQNQLLEKLVKCEDCWLMNGFGSVNVDVPPVYEDCTWMQSALQS